MNWRALLQILLALILLVGVNIIASRHYAHLDLSRSCRFSLSDQGSVLFSGIQRPAHIIVYFSPSSLTEGSELYNDVEALMKEYQIKAQKNLVIEYLDPARNLGRAREVQGTYHFQPNENVIIINYSDHTKIIPVKELGEYDCSAGGEAPRLIAFRGEQVINAALIELSGVPSKKIYFLQGHGEKMPGKSPLEIIGRYLQYQHVAVEPLNLAINSEPASTVPAADERPGADGAQQLSVQKVLEGASTGATKPVTAAVDSGCRVPEDAALLVIIGASYDLSASEAEALKNYWKRSGRLLILLDPTASTPFLSQVIAETGITPRSDRVVRLESLGNRLLSKLASADEVQEVSDAQNRSVYGNTQGFSGNAATKQFATEVEFRKKSNVTRDVIGAFIPGSELTKQFLELNIVFAGTTQSLDLAPISANNTDVQRRALIQATPGFFSCTEGTHEADKELSFIEGSDTPSPVIIAAMADRGALHDDRVAVHAARMVVIGNSDFIQDKSCAAVDLDFFSSCLNGLIDRVQLTGNTAKMKSYFTLNLDDAALQQITLWSMLIIPLLGALLGITIIWRRKL